MARVFTSGPRDLACIATVFRVKLHTTISYSGLPPFFALELEFSLLCFAASS
jgi:hypothetical protein